MLSRLEFVKLQHLLSDVHKDQLLMNDSNAPLSEFDPLSYQSPSGDSCLHIAVWQSNLAAVQLLIKGGIEINAKGDNGFTPLDCALSQNNADIVACVIEHGGVPNNCKDKVRKWIRDETELELQHPNRITLCHIKLLSSASK